MVMVRITYTAYNNGESIGYNFVNPMRSRMEAIHQIKKWKALNNTFRGLRLTLTCHRGDALIYELELLTGDSMCSEEIVMVLHDEFVVLHAYGYKPLIGVIHVEGNAISHVAHDFITLYYFTLE